MLQSLRNAYPALSKQIQPLNKLVREKYGISLTIHHPLFNEMIGALRGRNDFHPYDSKKPLTGQVNAWGKGYKTEPVRLTYQRFTQTPPAFYMAGYNVVTIYFEDQTQATEWIDWAVAIGQRFDMIEWIVKINAIDQSLKIGEVSLRQAKFRDYQYKVVFANKSFKDIEEKKKFLELMKSFDSEVIQNHWLKQLITPKKAKKDAWYWYNNDTTLYNCTMYCKDDSALLILQLSMPHLIKKIYHVKYLGK